MNNLPTFTEKYEPPTAATMRGQMRASAFRPVAPAEKRQFNDVWGNAR